MKINELLEAKSSGKSSMQTIISYLERKLGESLIKIPGAEHFHNSENNGYGVRYSVKGTLKMIRFNWASLGKVGNAGDIQSIDIFTGKRNPSFSIHAKGVSFVNTLPQLADILQKPAVKKHLTFPVSEKEALSESVSFNTVMLTEVKRDDFTAEAAVSDFFKGLAAGRTFTRSDFINNYHVVNVGIFDVIFNDFKDKFEIQSNRRLSIQPGTSLETLKDSILAKAGVLEVTPGASQEEYLKSKQEEEAEEADEHVPFGDVLEHLEGLVQGIVKGAFNALFVAGKGGTGKTQTVEKVLAQNGLTDGNGYFKNTGSASAAGVYTLLYQNRNGIILFDDSDGALADQDARNLIKAATDTKKIRKIVWNKKSSFIYDPDAEDAEEYENDPDMAPKYFNFTGRIIFISNLPLNKLDPDGALRTRAFVINVNPTDEEMVEHMGRILHEIKLEDGLSLSDNQREEVLEVVKTSKRKGDVSLRKLVRGLNLAASGVPNWEKLVSLYC